MVSRISDRSLAVEPYSIATINFFVSLERRLCNAVVDNLLKELLMKGIKMNIKGKCMQLLFPLSSIIRKKSLLIILLAKGLLMIYPVLLQVMMISTTDLTV
jgi:hypothetical protein